MGGVTERSHIELPFSQLMTSVIVVFRPQDGFLSEAYDAINILDRLRTLSSTARRRNQEERKTRMLTDQVSR